MKRNWFVGLFAAALMFLFPAVAMAQEEDKIYDARLEGYSSSVTLEGGSTALMWLLLVVMAGVCVAVMFKNARRTHLD